MSELIVKDKDIVVPGEILAVGMDFLPAGGAYREGEQIVASQLGLVNISNRLIKLIPLTGKYLPKKGDTVIGKVVTMTFSNWFIDIGCQNEGVMSLRDTSEFIDKGADLSQFYNFGDVVVAQVSKVTRGAIDLTMRGPGLRKLTPGKLVKVTPSKVPRIIGKEGSMITIIKDKTGCKIIVGQNGVIWISGTPEAEMLAYQAINLIQEKAHMEGLTDEVSKFLEKAKGG